MAVFFVSSLTAQELNVKVSAKSAILYNPDNRTILFQKRAREPQYPASIVKIATALFILDQENIDLQKVCRASKEALTIVPADEKQADFLHYAPYIIEHDGVTIGLKEGEGYSVESLLHGLLLASGNDAANVLAEEVGGTIPKFMEDMHLYLQKKGIHQTRFQNPHGLHHPAQMTTAYDMALITGMALENPIFCQTVTTSSYPFSEQKILSSNNRLLKEGKYRYSKYIGGKTGNIASVGYNLVAAAEHEGRRLIAVVLGCKKSDDRYQEAINLFEEAFREKKEKRLLFSKDHECFLQKIPNCEEPLKAKLDQDVEIQYFPSEESHVNAKLVWYEIQDRVEKSDIVGNLVVENAQGSLLCSAPLFAACTFEKTKNMHWKGWLYGFLVFAGIFTFYKKARKILKR